MTDTLSDGTPYLITEEAAIYLRKKPSTLEAWRSEGKGPAYSLIGNRAVYTVDDLDAYVLFHRKEPSQ